MNDLLNPIISPEIIDDSLDPGDPGFLDNGICFTVSRNASSVNFFPNIPTSVAPLASYEIYINNSLTNQSYNSLTFSANDKVKIKAKTGVNWYPLFSANNRNYIKSIDEPFPCMVYDANHSPIVISDLFTKCADLVSVHKDLFRYNTITNFQKVFLDCTNLTSVPEDLFKYNTTANLMNTVFSGCISLTSVPKNLFKYNINLTSTYGIFSGCTSLTSVPEDLFKNCTKTTSFVTLFYNCSKLKSIPNNLFKYNTEVSQFANTFYNCSDLTSIPKGLFDYNSKVYNFGYTFSRCYNVTSVPSDLFDNCPIVTNFNETFSYCTNITSAVPVIWNRSNVENYNKCYYQCTKAANYESISPKWK